MIYIIGNSQNSPKEGRQDNRSLRHDFQDAIAFFKERYPSEQQVGVNRCEHLHTHLYLNPYDASEEKFLHECLLHPVLSIGEVVAGDEKVFHYTSKQSMNVRVVPSKHEVGLWVYELVGRLSSKFFCF